ncbi:HAD hydrolase family protein [Fusobacterium varium]
MIKLIITDMDGTLLDDNNHIDEEFWELEKSLMKKVLSLLQQVEDNTITFFTDFLQLKMICFL